MASLRQQIIDQVVATLEALPVPVEPDRGVAIARDHATAIGVAWANEAVREVTYGHDAVGLQLMVTFYARESAVAEISADALADDLSVAGHRLLMADRTLGGLALDISALGARREGASADQDYVTITQAYDVAYRRRSTDISEGYP